MNTYKVLCRSENSVEETVLTIEALNPVELGESLEISGYKQVSIYNAYGVEVYNTYGSYFPYN